MRSSRPVPQAPTPPARDEPAWLLDAEPHHRPALRGEARADVCVVGLGGSGLACIEELLRLGRTVVGLDAGAVGGRAAGRNGGFLLGGTARFHHDACRAIGRERAVALYRHTLREIERVLADLPGIARATGSIRLADSEDEREDCRAQLESMREDGLPVEPWGGPEGDGLLFPRDASFHPLARCVAAARRAEAQGARLLERTAAVAIAGDRVETAEGAVRCDAVVVAVDGSLERVLPELEGRVRTARLQMLGTAPVEAVRIARPVYARWGYDYWQQLPDHRVVLGGGRDAAGDREWTGEAVPTAEVQAHLEALLRERLGIDAAITHRWAAGVAYTEDGLPVLEEVRPGVWATGAYSGTGNVLGTLCGRAAARLACGEGSEIVELLRGDPAAGVGSRSS